MHFFCTVRLRSDFIFKWLGSLSLYLADPYRQTELTVVKCRACALERCYLHPNQIRIVTVRCVAPLHRGSHYSFTMFGPPTKSQLKCLINVLAMYVHLRLPDVPVSGTCCWCNYSMLDTHNLSQIFNKYSV